MHDLSVLGMGFWPSRSSADRYSHRWFNIRVYINRLWGGVLEELCEELREELKSLHKGLCEELREELQVRLHHRYVTAFAPVLHYFNMYTTIYVYVFLPFP